MDFVIGSTMLDKMTLYTGDGLRKRTTILDKMTLYTGYGLRNRTTMLDKMTLYTGYGLRMIIWKIEKLWRFFISTGKHISLYKYIKRNDKLATIYHLFTLQCTKCDFFHLSCQQVDIDKNIKRCTI